MTYGGNPHLRKWCMTPHSKCGLQMVTSPKEGSLEVGLGGVTLQWRNLTIHCLRQVIKMNVNSEGHVD